MSIHERSTKRGPRFDVRLRGPDGREVKKTFKKRTEAKRYERQQLTERDRGAWVDPKRGVIPFSDVAAAWLDSNPGKRPGVRGRDAGILKVHVLPTIGNRHIGSITPAEIQKLINTWLAKKLSPGTVHRHYAIVRAIFTWAVEADYIARTPCRKTVVRLPKKSGTVSHHVITADELEKLGQALGPRYEPMVYLGAVMGLRWGEVAALRASSIDFLRRSIAVNEGVARDDKGRTILAEPKSDASRRQLAAPEFLLNMLSDHIASSGLTGDPDALLFTTARAPGEPLDYSNFHRLWLNAVTAVKLPAPTGATRQKYFGFHDLRRANATVMSLGDVDAKTAQSRMGHTDIRLTLSLYPQHSTAADKAAAEALGEHFFGGTRHESGMESTLDAASGDIEPQ